MARSIWKGIISFGLVSIPVKLYSATESHDISFHQLHAVCKTRIKQQRWCPHCDRVVEYEDIEKGYEFAKGEYVALDKEDFEKLPLPARHVVAIQAFVEREEIDPIYYDNSYYTEPEEAAVRPYALFLRALEEKGLVAVGTIALRNKESLCAIRPYGEALIVDMLLYEDEVRLKPEETKLPSVRLNKNELDMAKHLIDLMKADFDPAEFKDHYREALKKLIEAKLEGEEIAVPSTPKARVVDLMEALRASVQGVKKGQTPQVELEETEEDAGEAEITTSGKGKSKRTAAGTKRRAASKNGRTAARARNSETGTRGKSRSSTKSSRTTGTASTRAASSRSRKKSA